LKEYSVDIENVKIIHIPRMFVTKRGERLYRRGKARKEDLVCHLNTRKLQFDDAFIFSDTAIIGRVSCFWCTNINDSRFRDSTEIKFWQPLMLEIRKIAPDFIFRIHNLSQNYWYVKNNQLYVLTYDHTVYGLKNFVTVKADDYIKYHIEERNLVVLSHRIIESIVSSGSRE